MAQARFSIRAAVAEGFDFWRGNWRKAAGPLAIAALATAMQGVASAGPMLLGLALQFLALTVAQAVFYRIALADLGAEPASVNRPGGLQWGRLEGQLLVMGLLVSVIFFVTMIAGSFLLMALLGAVAEGVTLPQTMDITKIFEALSPKGQTTLALGLLAVMGVCLLLWARLSMAAPDTAASNRVRVLSSMPLTRGLILKLSALWLVIRAPIFLLSILGAQYGVLVGDPATGVLAQIIVNVVGVFFVEPILVGALAHIYRQVRLSQGTA